MNLDSLRLGIRYSDAGIATRSYVTRRLSMRLWSSGRQCRFKSILVPVVTTGQPGSPALDRLDFVYVCSSVWRPYSGGILQLRSNEVFVCCGFQFLFVWFDIPFEKA